MFQLVHKTLIRSLNIINVVKGRFIPKEEQTLYLFNLCTSFEIYSFDESKKTALQSKLFQHLFSKAFYMCIGPDIDNTDTFFVIRDTDILHFQYSEDENMFISINNFDLPKECITPNFASFVDNQLIVSCFHGGLCGFDITKSDAQLSFSIKPCTSVLQAFPVYKDCFFRIETGSSLTFYHTKPFSLEYKRKCDDQRGKRIFYSFSFGQEGVILCTESDLKCISTTSDIDHEISFPSDIPFDPIIDHSPIAPSDVLVLTKRGLILRLQSDLSLTTIVKRDKNLKLLRIFNLDMNHFLIVRKSMDHVILNISSNLIQTLSSTIGLSNLSIYNQKLYDSSCAYAPQVFSFSDDELLIYRQGRPLSLCTEFELPDDPTGLFHFTIENKDYLVVSFENGSKLLEVTKTSDQNIEVKDSRNSFPMIPFYEDGKTIGVIKNPKSSNQFFQVMPTEVANIPLSNNRATFPDKTIFITYTNCTNIRVTEKNTLIVKGSIRRIGSGVIENRVSFEYDLQFITTCLTVSPPDPNGFAEYVVLGAEYRDTLQFAVVFQIISDDQSEREEIINEKMPSRICSIEFLDQTPEKPLGILVGLENGSLFVGEVNFEKREIEKKQILQLGVSPCRISVFPSKSRPLRFGLSTRLWNLEQINGKNLIKAHPFSVTTPSFMAMDSEYRMFLISGRTFSVFKLQPKTSMNLDYFVQNKHMPSQIISLHIIDYTQNIMSKAYRKILTPLLLIICKTQVFVMDTTLPIIHSPIINFPNDTITNSSYTNRYAFTKLPPIYKECTLNSYLALTTIRVTSNQNREIPYYFIHIYKVDLNFFKNASMRPNDPKKNQQNIKASLLKPILSQQVNYIIDAISITCCQRILFNQLEKMEPFVVTASERTVYIYSCANNKLSLLSRIDHFGTKINHIKASLENHSNVIIVPVLSIYISDVQQSVSLYYYDITTNIVTLFSEEGSLRPISSELASYRFDNLINCGGDRLGNFFIFQTKGGYSVMNPVPKYFQNKSAESNSQSKTSSSQLVKQNGIPHSVQRLWLLFNFNVGDVITSVCPACDYDPTVPYPIWYSTISGTIGCFLDPSTFRKTQVLLSSLEVEISKLFFSLTHCDSLTFRNKYYQSYPICDLDVVEIFPKLSPQRKEYIYKKILEKNICKELGIQPSNIQEVLDAEILKCSSFFWLWN